MRPRKLLLALQFYAKDQPDAYALARTILNIENGAVQDLADFCFVPRFDTYHDENMTTAMTRSFDTFVVRGKTEAVGWPAGCNALWADLMAHVYRNEWYREYKAVLTFEPDAMPLTRDWIARLSAAWDRAGAGVVGHIHQTNGAHGSQQHINGNALFSTDPGFLEAILEELRDCPDQHGWDTYLAPLFEGMGWEDAPEIRSWYSRTGVRVSEYEDLVKSGAVFLHGVKDRSLANIVKTFVVPPDAAVRKSRILTG